MFAAILQRLEDTEVHRRLDGRRESFLGEGGLHLEHQLLTRLGQVCLDCRRNTAVRQCGRVNTARKIPHGGQGIRCLSLDFHQDLSSRGSVRLDQFLQDFQVHTDRDEVLLRAIVQVALDAPSLRVLGRHDTLA